LIVAILINSINGSTVDIESITQSLADAAARRIQNMRDDLKKEEKQLKIDRQKFEKEIQLPKPVDHTDIFQLNVGGEIILTTRQTLTKIPKSTLSILFNGQWEHKLSKDQNGNIFLDFNPILFRHLLDQLQIIETNNSIQFYPPSQPSLVEPFKKMIRKLGLQQSSSSEKKNVITFNVGGQKITNQRTTFTQVSSSTFDTIVPPTTKINFNNETHVFVDYDPKLFQHLIKQLRKKSYRNISSSELSKKEKIAFETMLIDFSIFVRSKSHIAFISLIGTHVGLSTKLVFVKGNEFATKLNSPSYSIFIYI
jgi:hypothetical protein